MEIRKWKEENGNSKMEIVKWEKKTDIGKRKIAKWNRVKGICILNMISAVSALHTM